MRKWNRILMFAAALAALCAGFTSFAQDTRFSMVPDGASMVINVNFEKLYSSSTFKSLAESGEVSSLRDDLKKIPWNGNGVIPDPLLVFAPRMGFGKYVVLLDADNDLKGLADQLATLNGTKKTVETADRGAGRMITVKRPKTDKKTQKVIQKTEAEILCLASHTAVFARDKCPLDVTLFSGKPLPAAEFDSIRKLPENVVAAGIMRQFPIPPDQDLTGLSSLVKSGDFVFSEYEPGAALLVINMDCKGEKEAKTAARRLNSIVRIAFVTLFAADPDLFKKLNRSFSSAYSGTTATFEFKLGKSTLDEIRAFYLSDRSILSAVKDTLAKPGDQKK